MASRSRTALPPRASIWSWSPPATTARAASARSRSRHARHQGAGDRRRRRHGRGLRAADRRRRARAFGGCDILINNAGSGSNETILEAPDEKWQHYWDLHVMAAVRLVARPGARHARARRRRDPQQRLDLRPAAALVRADLQHHQGSAGDVLQEPRQRADPVQHPGQRAQPRPRPHPRLDQDRDPAHRGHRPRPGRTTSRSIAEQHAPIKRFATPEEIASYFVFLCSDKATYSVGSTYYVDGGMLRTIA